MEIKINIVETASMLADRELYNKYNELNKNKSAEELAAILFEEKEKDVITYKSDIQKEFDELYDEYYSILLNNRCDE